MKKLLKFSSVLAIIAGIVLVCGSLWGIGFINKNIAREKIVTPDDASIPSVPLKGPFTLKAQADIIWKHALDGAGGKTYAEMPRLIPQVDSNGEEIVDAEGKPVMVSNQARNTWVTATTLITALNLGILTYVFSGLVLLIGLISIWTGIIFWALSKKFN